MSHDVIATRHLGEYRLEIRFANGKSGVVDFEKFIKKGGVFAKLAQLELFQKFLINQELGVLTWNNEIDIAPETLYSEATGDSLPSWVDQEWLKKKTA